METACIRCGSCHTRRHDFRTYRVIDLSGVHSKGYQRWFCVDCRRPFVPEVHQRKDASPYDEAVREKAAILYVDTGASYRATVRELKRGGLSHAHAKQVWHWVQAIAHRCADPFTISQRLRPSWSGWLQVDGDRLPGLEESILAALDVGTRDVPCAGVGREGYASYLQLFQQLKAVKYPLRGITSDGDGAIVRAAAATFGKVIHQRCTVHFGRNVDELLEPHYATFPQLPTEYERFQKTYAAFVTAPTWEKAKGWLQVMLHYPSFQRPHFQAARQLFLKTLPQIIQAFFHPDMPRTNNLIENLFSFLDRRITPMDHFKSPDTARAMVKLLILYYRFHQFSTPSKAYRHIKGKSPLQLAGVHTAALNWLSVGIQ